ncbi:hypothetical protein BaRGS_00001075 [Batillaria attramentaria]|uniref:Uncharacterized protein n=1 Tax=Batillaria attramentaria TaxID=370345 RepID=A0ABD0M5B4_9CAEN
MIVQPSSSFPMALRKDKTQRCSRSASGGVKALEESTRTSVSGNESERLEVPEKKEKDKINQRGGNDGALSIRTYYIN